MQKGVETAKHSESQSNKRISVRNLPGAIGEWALILTTGIFYFLRTLANKPPRNSDKNLRP